MTKNLNDNYEKKNKKTKEPKYRSEEQQEVIRFVAILIGIIIIIGLVFIVSNVFIKNDNEESETDVVAGQINYDLVSIGTMLNRLDNEYYVAIYKKSSSDAMMYSTIINKYLTDNYLKGYLPIYFCDLDNRLNTDYYVGTDKESNPKATKIEELALGDFTFIKVKSGKIIGYYENIDDVKKELKV